MLILFSTGLGINGLHGNLELPRQHFVLKQLLKQLRGCRVMNRTSSVLTFD